MNHVTSISRFQFRLQLLVLLGFCLGCFSLIFLPGTSSNSNSFNYSHDLHCNWLPTIKANVLPLIRDSEIPSEPLPFDEAWLKPDYARYGPAIQAIPKVLQSGYDLNGKIPIRNFMFDQAYLGSTALVSTWTLGMIQDFFQKIKARTMQFNYPSEHVYQCLDKYSASAIRGKHGLVVGSENPWLESMLLFYGASHVTTLEFGKIISEHPQLSTITPQELTLQFVRGKISSNQYDFVFSFSSLEHDGLGRYGDILNPKADLQMMSRLMTILKPQGFFFLAVMTGPDAIEFNAHRIYGPIRYPLMMSGYHLVESFGDENNQPIMVLQNRYGCSNGIPKKKIFHV